MFNQKLLKWPKIQQNRPPFQVHPAFHDPMLNGKADDQPRFIYLFKQKRRDNI